VRQFQNNQQEKSPKEKNTLKSLAEAYQSLAPYLNIGYIFAASVAIFTFAGYFLDNKWETSPWLTVVGAVLGITAGFYNFFKTVLGPEKNKDEGND
jgi:F0F1-type ATP synthase assembly protein I